MELLKHHCTFHKRNEIEKKSAGKKISQVRITLLQTA